MHLLYTTLHNSLSSNIGTPPIVNSPMLPVFYEAVSFRCRVGVGYIDRSGWRRWYVPLWAGKWQLATDRLTIRIYSVFIFQGTVLLKLLSERNWASLYSMEQSVIFLFIVIHILETIVQKCTAIYVVKLIFWRHKKYELLLHVSQDIYTLCNLILNRYVTKIKWDNLLQQKII
jgi:hypothetical protein